MLKVDLGAIKIQSQEKEKKYFEGIRILKEKNDDLQKTINLKEKALAESSFLRSGQLSVLTAENTKLKSEVESKAK